MAEALNDPSRFFVSGSRFADELSGVGVKRTDIQSEIAPHFSPVWMETRFSVLDYYTDITNVLISGGTISPPLARLDKNYKTGVIINPGRGIRPVGGESPLRPGNEHMTPPSFLEIRNEDGWLIRIFVNAFAYGYPRREILEDSSTSRIRIETVPILSIVAALNPRRPLYDMNYEAMEFMQLWSYSMAQINEMIMHREVVYLDMVDGRYKPFNSFIGFGNIAAPEFVKDSGGSVETPHTQGIFYADGYAPSFYEGMAEDENGNCGRCIGIEEKLNSGVSGRVIAVRGNALLYVPETEAVVKGETIRITPRAHYPNWTSPVNDLLVLQDIVDLTQRGMWAMGKRQGRPSFNVIWAQGKEGHMFTQVQTGTPAGGFSTVAPVFRIGDTRGGEIRPDTTYFDPETIAREYRAMETIFPPKLNSL